MWKHSISLLLLMVQTGLLFGAAQADSVQHDLQVTLEPGQGRIEVRDQIRLPAAVRSLRFVLHEALTVEISQPGAELSVLGRVRGSVSGVRYRVEFEQPQRRLALRYQGTIDHPVGRDSLGAAGERPRGTAGTISAEGVFLAGSTLWYPLMPGRMMTFTLRVTLPEGWLAISQGEPLPGDGGWREAAPQDDIYLIAGQYRRYRSNDADVQALVYLRRADDELAQRYLQATSRYIALYQRLLGAYPYRKFAMVENFWESGYGMPSFTLLGPRVLRFPFILDSSYPHEILHNWWGNGVYVDHTQGNWSEGLTAYLADHLLREQEGRGSTYRRDTLQRYADFVHRGNDFPLASFRGRHGDSSQAIGYGKTLMFFHALRRKLGDDRFLEGLRQFYREHLFRTAGYADLRAAFEAVSNIDLAETFAQWTERTGAPAISVADVSVSDAGDNYRIDGLLRQTQPAAAYPVTVPLFVQLPDGKSSEFGIEMRNSEERFSITLPKRPLRLAVDPHFDLFRQLADGETPSSLGQLFGARAMTIVLPADSPRETRAALERLAAAWARRWKDLDIVWDSDLKRLPDGRGLWLFGQENRFADTLIERMSGQMTRIDAQRMIVGGASLSTSEHSYAVTAPRGDHAIGLLHLAEPAAAAGLARKLPHYGKYSYTIFAGREPKNMHKGQWSTGDSELWVDLGGDLDLPNWSPPERAPLTASIDSKPVHKN